MSVHALDTDMRYLLYACVAVCGAAEPALGIPLPGPSMLQDEPGLRLGMSVQRYDQESHRVAQPVSVYVDAGRLLAAIQALRLDIEAAERAYNGTSHTATLHIPHGHAIDMHTKDRE